MPGHSFFEPILKIMRIYLKNGDYSLIPKNSADWNERFRKEQEFVPIVATVLKGQAKVANDELMKVCKNEIAFIIGV